MEIMTMFEASRRESAGENSSPFARARFGRVRSHALGRMAGLQRLGALCVIAGLVPLAGGGFVGGAAASAGATTHAGSAPMGGSTNAITINVTGSPLTNIITTAVALSPGFDRKTTDYVLFAKTASVMPTFRFHSSGIITVNGQSGSTVSVSESLVSNQAVIVNAPDGTQYWIRVLPPGFPHVSLTNTGTTSPGYYLTGTLNDTQFGVTPYPMILNSNGTPVWYLTGIPASASDVELIPGTHTVAWAPRAYNGFYYLYNIDTQTWTKLIPPVPVPDGHELFVDPQGNRWMMSEPTRSGYDLTPIGFPNVHDIIDCVVQELDPNGTLLWKWRASDFISPNEADSLTGVHGSGTKAQADVYHCNSIDVDPGNPNHVVMSLRHTGVYLIDKATGVPIWKLGGTSAPPMDHEPVLTIVGDPEGQIKGQHDARFQPNGDMSIFDDHSTIAGAARGVEYAINTTNNTATMNWEYAAPNGLSSSSMGSFRRYDSNLTTYSESGAAYAGPSENLIDWGHGIPQTGFTAVTNAGSPLFTVMFPSGELTNRAIKVPLSALDLTGLRNGAGNPF